MNKEQEKISAHNHYLAWKHFWPEGNGSPKKGYCLHHIDPSWQTEDIDRYIQWNVDDLVMLTMGEHTALHNSLRTGEKNPRFGKHHSDETKHKISIANSGKHHSDETKKKMSIANSGKTFSNETKKKMSDAHIGKNNPMFGKHHSEQAKQQMSITKSGEKNPAFGRHWWNNGIEQRYCKECPAGFVKGMLKL